MKTNKADWPLTYRIGVTFAVAFILTVMICSAFLAVIIFTMPKEPQAVNFTALLCQVTGFFISAFGSSLLMLYILLRQKVLLPVRRIAYQVQQISRGTSNQEIHAPYSGELGVLVTSFNRMKRTLVQPPVQAPTQVQEKNVP
jgi:nitrate/nitrite-specific signal transduction histidine kinase